MAKNERHPDVVFSVAIGHKDLMFDSLASAAPYALSAALADSHAYIDVMVHSEAGAEWYGGEEARALFVENPGLSVLDRIEVRTASLGSVG